MTINVERRKKNFDALCDLVNITVPQFSLWLAGNTVDSIYTAYVGDLCKEDMLVVIVATEIGFTEVFPNGEVKKQFNVAGVWSDIIFFFMEE